MVYNFTDKNMQKDELKKLGTVLVDFWAAWCGPCRMMAPNIEKAAEEYAGKLTVAKLNIDDYTDCAIALGINSIPDLFIFKDGEPADNLVGFVPYETLKEFIDKNI